MRPGLMWNGEVLIAPSRLDATGGREVDRVWLNRVEVTVNGRPLPGVVAYDEREGMALVATRREGEFNAPTIIHGKVKARPRYVLALNG